MLKSEYSQGIDRGIFNQITKIKKFAIPINPNSTFQPF
jgi:hypothetical protein